MFGFPKHYLLAGDIFATEEPTEVSTVLGSCVSVCLWDHKRNIGGVNHYLSPLPLKRDRRSGRYGEMAIPRLIRGLMDLGARKPDLRAKVFGGGKVLDLHLDVGAENVAVARNVLRREGVRVLEWDVGGRMGRSITFHTHSGASSSRPILSVYDSFREKQEHEAALPGSLVRPRNLIF